MKKAVVTITVIILIAVIAYNFGLPWYFIWSIEHNNPSQTELCLSMSKKLLSYKPMRSGNPITMVQVATGSGSERSLKILLEHGADPNEKFMGTTSLNSAAFFGEDKIIEILLKYGADVNIVDDGEVWQSRTAVHAAVSGRKYKWSEDRVAEGNNDAALKLLIEAGANLNVQDDDGDTPLHRAAYEGYLYGVEALISAGAKTNIKNKKGQTPLDMALKKTGKTSSSDEDVERIIELLKAKGG